MIDQKLLKQLQNRNLEYQISKAFGDEQPASLSEFFAFISELYKYHPPEKINWDFQCLVTKQAVSTIQGKVVHRQDVFQLFSASVKCIVIIDLNTCILSNLSCLNTDEILLNYQWLKGIETLEANQKAISIINPESCSVSIFAQATFKDLDEALRKYYLNRSKYALCPELKKCWATPERLRFLPKPENAMQESLFRYLKDVIRGDPEINREQNIDDSNPVDIKIVWKSTAANALIEIKWLGISFDPQTKKITKEFSQDRAAKGAEQLQGYLFMAKKEHPEIYHEGYLVIFDGRRRGIRNFDSVTSLENAEYYRDKEIEYPEAYQNDQMLKLEYRFFIEPELRCS